MTVAKRIFIFVYIKDTMGYRTNKSIRRTNKKKQCTKKRRNRIKGGGLYSDGKEYFIINKNEEMISCYKYGKFVYPTLWDIKTKTHVEELKPLTEENTNLNNSVQVDIEMIIFQIYTDEDKYKDVIFAYPKTYAGHVMEHCFLVLTKKSDNTFKITYWGDGIKITNFWNHKKVTQDEHPLLTSFFYLEESSPGE